MTFDVVAKIFYLTIRMRISDIGGKTIHPRRRSLILLFDAYSIIDGNEQKMQPGTVVAPLSSSAGRGGLCSSVTFEMAAGHVCHDVSHFLSCWSHFLEFSAVLFFVLDHLCVEA